MQKKLPGSEIILILCEKILMKRIIKIFILTFEIVLFVLLLGYYYNEPLTKYTTKQVRQMKLITLFTKYNVKPEGLES